MPSSNSDLDLVPEMDFLLPDNIPIDPEATLNQLTGRFRSMRDGLAELIKNSKDQYSRLGIFDQDRRQIIVALSTTAKTLAVIDFAGAPSQNFVGWTKWSDPSAGQVDLAPDIEAGHGNGGKAFMVRGATKRAYLDSTFKGRRTRKGFVNDQAGRRYRPGFGVEDGQPLDDVQNEHPAASLQKILESVGAQIKDLPRPAQDVFVERQAYTAAFVEQIEDWQRRHRRKLKQAAAREVAEIISTHGQTSMTIETCHVWVVVDGEIYSDGPIQPALIEPYQGFEEPRLFPIPDVLPDPETGESVDIFEGNEGDAYLSLHASAKQLQISQETRAKNVIRVWNNRNNVATWPLQTLHRVSAASFIFGKLQCPSLQDEHLAGADRLHLNDTALVRALEHWVGEKVQELANDLHQAMAEKTNPKDRERARSALNNIRKLMRRFLDADASGNSEIDGRDGAHDGSQEGGDQEEREPVEYGRRVDEIILERNRNDISLICGSSVPLLFSCLEKDPETFESHPVRNASITFACEPADQFEFDGKGMITAKYPGLGKVWLETADGSTISNVVQVWVAQATDVTMTPLPAALKQGEKRQLRFTFETDSGPLDHVLVKAEVVPSSMGRIGRHGKFSAGYEEGEAQIRVRFGEGDEAFRDFIVEIGSERVPPPEGKGDAGSDVPEILFCGDDAPGMNEFPPDQRTVVGGPELPTIIEDPLFPNVVWINPASKEALRVRRTGGGSSGVSRVTSRTFIHFVALKCFDILKRLHVRQQIAGSMVTEFQYMQAATEAEMECADFIDAAWELGDQLLSKEGFADA